MTVVPVLPPVDGGDGVVGGVYPPPPPQLIDATRAARSVRRMFFACTALPSAADKGKAGAAKVSAKSLKMTELLRSCITAGESGYRERKSRSFHTVLGEVVAESALTDSHRFSCVLFDTSGGVQCAADGFALGPVEILAQVR